MQNSEFNYMNFKSLISKNNKHIFKEICKFYELLRVSRQYLKLLYLIRGCSSIMSAHIWPF